MSKPALLTLLLMACTRGGGARDAGVVHRSTDLRSAYLVMYPEYRGTTVVSSRATLTRSLSGDVKDLSLPGQRAPFVLTATLLPHGAQLTLTLPIPEDAVNKAMMAPASLSTETMAQLLPAIAGTAVVSEDFELQLTWRAAFAERPWFIVRQLISGALSIGWQPTAPLPFTAGEKLPDAGAAPIPDPLDVTLRDTGRGAQLAIHREAETVTISYRLRTIDSAP